MTLDIDLVLAPDGANGITLTFAPGGGAGAVLSRPLPALNPASLDDLRRGDAPQAVVDELRDAVSAWLLGTDLGQPLATAIDGGERLRLLVHTDRSLLATLGDLPVELVTINGALLPLVIHPKVDGIVHVPPGTGTPPKVAAHDWPLRVLFVRSNPADLGGAVPPAAPIVAGIRAAAPNVPDDALVIEVVSSEIPGDEAVTWRRFRDTLASQRFDILVYLGHGDLQQGFAETEPIGYLQFESLDGVGHESVNAQRIARELYLQPVRVVMLAGCLTAANLGALPPGAQAQLLSELPRWLRGAEGVAQAIIDSEAGVELTIGMRHRLEVEQATTFLASFFESLLARDLGDVERAVRAARYELFQAIGDSPSWSSAVTFAKGAAPMFDFLAQPPPRAAYSAKRQAQLETFRTMRRMIAAKFLEVRSDRTPFVELLEAVAADESPALGTDAMIRPRFVRTAPGKVRIEVDLVNPITVHRLSAEVRIDGPDVTIDRLRTDPRVAAAGFSLLRGDEEQAKVRIVIERDKAGRAKLAAGPLFAIEATLADAPPAIHEVFATVLESDSKAPVWTGMDMIAVVP